MKKLPYLLLCGLFLFALPLQAADFTVSGKVSLITEKAGFPFAEVHIADGNGKYIITVKTNPKGIFSHTFDIPEDEEVSFEGSVQDHCSGQPLIEAFEKSGSEVKLQFIVCQPIEEEGMEDGKGEDCFCPEYYHPVCVILEDSSQVEFSNECFAICEGYTNFFSCDIKNEGNNCEQFGLNFPVCVISGTDTISYSNPCAAMDAGHQWQELKVCDAYQEPNFTCEDIGFDIPILVCVTDSAGEDIKIPVCQALAEGYPLSQIIFCDGFGSLGDLGGLNLSCELLGIDIPLNVCVSDTAGNTQNIPICEALKIGTPLSQIEFCPNLSDSLGSLDTIDCIALGIKLPVCIIDQDGNSLSFNNPCEALNAGYTVQEFNFCPDTTGNGNGLSGLNCETFGLDLPVNVCYTDNNGVQTQLLLCDALAQGLPLDAIELCDSSIYQLDCAALGLNIAVCVVDDTGTKIQYESPCAALAAGSSLNQITFCDSFPNIDNISCNLFGIDIPVTVCYTNELGETKELLLCEALNQGISLENIEVCDSNIFQLDCAALGINIPVCVIDEEGNKIKYTNPCDALAAGNKIAQITLCDGLPDLNNISCEAFGLDIPVTVCYTDELGETKEILLCDALDKGLALDKIELCDSSIYQLDCQALGINVPVCVIDAEGNKTNYANPCEAIAAGNSISKITFCDGLPNIDGLSCETFGINIPFPVCVIENGVEVSYNICDALLLGISPQEMVLCEGLLDSISGTDCEAAGIQLPVCVIDSEGNKKEYNNPCAAIEAGHEIGDLTFCNGLIGADGNETITNYTKDLETLIEGIKLYPNPVNNTLNMDLQISENIEFEVRILSINGNAIYRQKYNAFDTNNVVQLDVSSLRAGIYMAQVITKNGSSVQKFSKF